MKRRYCTPLSCAGRSYARQSVDKKDSISIESQIEFCKYELKGGNCKEYKDKGYSGKNTERPQFQQLMRDIESGLVRKVVVYKLDRISRSILDFAKMMDFFQKYEVEFVSSTEMADNVPGSFQLPQRTANSVHALFADGGKPSGGIVPVLR